MYRGKAIGLVIPAYNEEKLIKPTLTGVPDYIDRVYVIDDGSTDSMPSVVEALAVEDSRIQLVRHGKNLGVGQAIISGYKIALENNCDIVLVVGGDFQMPLEEAPDFIDPLIDDKADYTKGNRFLPGRGAFDKMPKIRLFGNMIITSMTKIASGYYHILDVVDGYTAITSRALRFVDWDKAWKGYGYPMDFLIRLNTAGLRVMDIPRTAVYLPGERQSQIKGVRYAMRVAPMLIRGFFWRLNNKYGFYNFHPLILFFLFGMIFIPVGFLYGMYLVWKQISGLGVSGPQAVLCALFLIMGLQFFLFGMLFDMQETRR